MKRTIKTLAVSGVVAALGVAGVVYAGLVNVGADDPHFAPVHAFLTAVRERSIAVRSRDIEAPNLNDEALIRAGAGNYNSMCIGCHLAPGTAETELSQSLYPAPPNLTKVGVDGSPTTAFWIIKHGIKATGMPAWGKSMQDQYIWGMVAFLQQLPTLDAEKYQALIASSGGHQHGGGETGMHDHEGQHASSKAAGAEHHDAAGSDHHAQALAEEEGDASQHDSGHAHEVPESAPKTHTHADGKKHVHAN
ncbi:MAG: c-type cytochrome [Pseudomonas sp.]